MTLRQKSVVILLSSSTLICTIVIALFLGAELMAFLSTETMTTVLITRWLRLGLGILFVGVLVAVVGILIGCPQGDDVKADNDPKPAE